MPTTEQIKDPTPLEKKKEVKIEKTVHRVRRSRRFIWGCLIVVALLCVGSVIGVVVVQWVVPQVRQYLIEHNYVNVNDSSSNRESNQSNDKDSTGNRNTTVQVVEKIKNGVISIAVKDAQLDQNNRTNDTPDNIGTGFVVDSKGTILTNQHVVSNPDVSYVVVTHDNKKYNVTKVVRDDVNDIAVVIVDTKGDTLTPVALGDSDRIKVGEEVIAIGTPLGDLPGTVTRGIVSGLGRTVQTRDSRFVGIINRYEGVIQTDAAINPGNSGGPLVNMNGEVIGINFATTGGADNISFALPINLAKNRLQEYRTSGKFIRPFIGVSYRLISSLEANSVVPPVVPGALVQQVVAGSPAEKSGLKVGDIVTKVNKDEVKTTLSALIQKYKVGEKVSLTIWRDGKTSTLTLTLAEAQ